MDEIHKKPVLKKKTKYINQKVLLFYLESGFMSQQAIAIAINCFGESLLQYF
jgi:hypothetical protein